MDATDPEPISLPGPLQAHTRPTAMCPSLPVVTDPQDVALMQVDSASFGVQHAHMQRRVSSDTTDPETEFAFVSAPPLGPSQLEIPDYWPKASVFPPFWSAEQVLPPLPNDPEWYLKDRLSGLISTGGIPRGIQDAFCDRNHCVRLLLATDFRPTTMQALYEGVTCCDPANPDDTANWVLPPLWDVVRQNELELCMQKGWHLPCTQFPYICYKQNLAQRLLSPEKAAVELHRTSSLYHHMAVFVEKHRGGSPWAALDHLDCPCLHIKAQLSWPTHLKPIDEDGWKLSVMFLHQEFGHRKCDHSHYMLQARKALSLRDHRVHKAACTYVQAAHGAVTFNRTPPRWFKPKRSRKPVVVAGDPLYDASLKNVLKETAAGHTSSYSAAALAFPELQLPKIPDHIISTFPVEQGSEEPPKYRLVFNDSSPKGISINDAIISPGGLFPTNESFSRSIISRDRAQGLVDWVSAFKTMAQRPDQWPLSVYWAPGIHIRQADGTVKSTDLETWHLQLLRGNDFGRSPNPSAFNGQANEVTVHVLASGGYTATNYLDDHVGAGPNSAIVWDAACPPEMTQADMVSLFENIIQACGAKTDRKGTVTGPLGIYTGVERDIAKGLQRGASPKVKRQQERAQVLLLQRTSRGAHNYVPTELLKEYTYKTNFHCASMPMGRIFISACFFCLNKAVKNGSAVADCPASLVEELELARDHVFELNKHGTALPHMRPQLPYLSKWDNNGDACYKPVSEKRAASKGGYAYFCVAAAPEEPARLRWKEFTRAELDEMERLCPGNPIIMAEAQTVVRSAIFNGPRGWKGRKTHFGEDNSTVEAWYEDGKPRHLAGSGMVKTVQAIAFANDCDFGARRLNTKEQLISDLGSRLVDDYDATRPKLDAALCMWRVGHWLRTGRYVQTVVEKDDNHNDCLYTRPADRRVWVDAAVDHAASTELSTRL